MAYKRLSKRFSTIYFSEVRDLESGAVIGKLANLSETGMLLIDVVSLRPGSVHDLIVTLPQEVAGCLEFVCRAEIRWCRTDTNPDHLAAGLEFRDVSDELRAVLTAAQNQICFRNM